MNVPFNAYIFIFAVMFQSEFSVLKLIKKLRWRIMTAPLLFPLFDERFAEYVKHFPRQLKIDWLAILTNGVAGELIKRVLWTYALINEPLSSIDEIQRPYRWLF